MGMHNVSTASAGAGSSGAGTSGAGTSGADAGGSGAGVQAGSGSPGSDPGKVADPGKAADASQTQASAVLEEARAAAKSGTRAILTGGKPSATQLAEEAKERLGDASVRKERVDPTRHDAVLGKSSERIAESAKLPDNLLDIQDDQLGDELLKGGHTGLPPAVEVLRHATDDVRKLVGNLRADYTRKTQELAAERQKIQEMQSKTSEEQARLAALASPDFKASIEAAIAAAKDADPFTEEGEKKRREAETAKMLNEMLEPLRQKMEEQAVSARVDAFIARNPDIRTNPFIRTETAKLLKQNDRLSLEDAYQIVKGRFLAQERENEERIKREETAARAGVMNRTGGATGGSAGAVAPKFKNATDAFEHAKSGGKVDTANRRSWLRKH